MNELTESDNLTDPGDGEDYARHPDGTFKVGTRPGPGRTPHATSMARLRGKLMECITPEDIADCVAALRQIVKDAGAKAGDRLRAIEQLLDRGTGKPGPGDLGELVREVEALLGVQPGGDK